MDAISLLLKDHEMLRKLAKEFADTTEDQVDARTKMLKRLENELNAHTTIEEELLYPALVAATDDVEDERRVAEGIEEHRVCDKKVIPDLHKSDPSSISYSGQAKVLKDYIFHHLKEEEEDMFPKIRRLIASKDLQQLGDKMLARKKELLGELA